MANGVDARGFSGRVYDLLGRRVAVLQPGPLGRLQWTFGSGTNPGVYLVQVSVPDLSGRLRTRTLKAALLP